MKAITRFWMIIGLLLSMTQAQAALVKTVSGPEQTPPQILANLFGQTLYVFDPDQNMPNSVCNGVCAEHWPPYIVDSAELTPEDVSQGLGTLPRKSGDLQLTLNGRPLYTFYEDRKPLDTLGDGLGGVWHVVRVMTPIGQ